MRIYLDFDGSICDNYRRYSNVYKIALKEVKRFASEQGEELNLCSLRFWELKERMREKPEKEEIARLSGVPDCYLSYYEEIINRWANHPSKILLDRPLRGSLQSLTRLQEFGGKIVIVTLRPKEEVKQILGKKVLNNILIFGRFPNDNLPNDRFQAKAWLLKQALSSFDPRRKEISYMIGDTEVNMYAGNSNNVSTIALTCGMRSFGFHSRSIHYSGNIFPTFADTVKYLISNLRNTA